MTEAQDIYDKHLRQDIILHHEPVLVRKILYDLMVSALGPQTLGLEMLKHYRKEMLDKENSLEIRLVFQRVHLATLNYVLALETIFGPPSIPHPHPENASP